MAGEYSGLDRFSRKLSKRTRSLFRAGRSHVYGNVNYIYALFVRRDFLGGPLTFRRCIVRPPIYGLVALHLSEVKARKTSWKRRFLDRLETQSNDQFVSARTHAE